MTELRQSIEKIGLRDPLKVVPCGDNKYRVIGGHRRLAVLREIQSVDFEVPVIIYSDLTDDEADNLSYLDNEEREQLGSVEKAKHIQRMQKQYGWTLEKLSENGYGNRTTISELLHLLELPLEVLVNISAHAEIFTRHCKYIWQLNPKTDYTVYSDEYDENRNPIPLKTVRVYRLWQSITKICPEHCTERIQLWKQERQYRKSLQLNLAEQIEQNGLSVKRTAEKVKVLKQELKDRDEKLQEQLQKLYDGIQEQKKVLDGIYFKSSEDMTELADNSVHLIVTSPPYLADKEYEQGVSIAKYLKTMIKVAKECARVLVPGGRLCLNIGDVPNINKGQKDTKPEMFLVGNIAQRMLRKRGLRLSDKIIWKKDDPWHSNPHIVYDGRQCQYRILPSTEYIYIFVKEGKRECSESQKMLSAITKDEWTAWSSGLWSIPSVRANDDHPSMFPEELPNRLIKMYSVKSDNVLDPFLGSGTTIKVARELERVGIGYEVNEQYKDVIINKLTKKEKTNED